jgi:hypothetical protein
MQKAQKNLQQSQPNDAEEDEKKALEDLEQAKKDLEDELEELRRQAEEELLIQLETELRKFIDQQENINKVTKELDGVRKSKGVLVRDDVIKAKLLAKGQDDLAKAVMEVAKKLDQEDVQVFRYVLDSVIDDMTESASNLREPEPGERTQEVQADAVRKMKELVEAFNIKRRQGKGGQPPGGGQPGGGKKPLVPDIVQLNMMKKLQEELLRKTKDVQKNYRANREDLSEGEKMLLRRLADEQGKLSDLMKKFIEKFDKQKQELEKKNP